MHIPDGILNTPVIVMTNTFSIGTLGWIWKGIRRHLTQQMIPRIALLAAFLFVAQMINIPVSGGTSAHLAGATLAVLIAGPAMGIFALILVLTVQMFIFQDGGLLAWGANVLNIGIIPVFVSYLLFKFYYKMFEKQTHIITLRATSVFLASWLSIQAGAISCGIQLGLSGLAPLRNIVSVMMAVHSVSGILEGVLTVLIFELIAANRPDLVFSFFAKRELAHD